VSIPIVGDSRAAQYGVHVSKILPAIFFGHGNPMNALIDATVKPLLPVAVAAISIAMQTTSTPAYLVYVASEAADKIALVRFAAGSGRMDHEISTGIMPTDIDGPHGLAMSPDRRFYYVSLAHGQPMAPCGSTRPRMTPWSDA
jgi:hypothetical protein